jgi:hypothetical protein
MMVGFVYQRLIRHQFRNIPTYIDFCDIGEERCHKTPIRSFSRDAWAPQGLQRSFKVHRHHRLIMDAVGRNLDDFYSTFELASAVHDTLIGMSVRTFSYAIR